MADITGSTSAGGATIKYDVNPEAPSVTCSLYYSGIKLGSGTLDSTHGSITIGGSVPDTGITCKATLVANWSSKTVTYSITVAAPMSKKKTYNGTVVSW
jgi:hypothetical protein